MSNLETNTILMVKQVFPLNKPHTAELAGVRSILRGNVDPHVHSKKRRTIKV